MNADFVVTLNNMRDFDGLKTNTIHFCSVIASETKQYRRQRHGWIASLAMTDIN